METFSILKPPPAAMRVIAVVAPEPVLVIVSDGDAYGEFRLELRDLLDFNRIQRAMPSVDEQPDNIKPAERGSWWMARLGSLLVREWQEPAPAKSPGILGQLVGRR